MQEQNVKRTPRSPTETLDHIDGLGSPLVVIDVVVTGLAKLAFTATEPDADADAAADGVAALPGAELVVGALLLKPPRPLVTVTVFGG